MKMRFCLSPMPLAAVMLWVGFAGAETPPEPGPLQLEPVPAATVAPLPVRPSVPSGTAGPVRVSSSLDKAIITVGDLITYTLEVEAPEGSQVAMPQPGAELGGFIIRDYQTPPAQKRGANLVQALTYQITAYTTGTLEIPPLPVMVKLPNGVVLGLVTEAVQIRVIPVSNPDDLEIREVKPPVLIPINWRPYYLYGGSALGFLLLAGGVVWYLLRWRPRPEEMPAPVKPAYELFQEELHLLLSLRLLEAGEVEAFYTKLSEIVRRYLALRYRIYALEYTTTEILEHLRGKGLETRAFSRVQWLLEETDLVKFARYVPAPEAQKEIAEKARELVEWTREPEPLPVAVPELSASAPEARDSA